MINRDIIPVCKAWKRKERITNFMMFLCAATIVLIGYSCSRQQSATQCLSSHYIDVSQNFTWNRFVSYFKRHGSKTPQLMATAVMETKRPKLMAAIAVKESGGNLKALGDLKKSKGAFQVQPRHWKALLHEKKVSEDAITQALDSERILDALLIENYGDMKKALNAYNGNRTKKDYAKNILAELENTP